MAPIREVLVSAPAKVNLGLAISTRRNAAGYHLADTIMVAVGVEDTLTIRQQDEGTAGAPVPAAATAPTPTLMPAPAPAIARYELTGDDLGLPPERNLVYRAATELASEFGMGGSYTIELEKAIPMEAGLGGGSSDAAATLVGLCALWGESPTGPRVLRVARGLGADVPFFLGESPALLGGVGDRLVSTLPLPYGAAVLVRRPGPGVSTREAYAAFDRDPQPVPDLAMLEFGLAMEDIDIVGEQLANNLEPAAFALCPGLEDLKGWVASQSGVRGALVSGSGSAVFGLCLRLEEAEAVATAAREQGWWAQAARFLRHGASIR